MAVFESTKMGNSDPVILIGLVRIGGSQASLRGESEFSDTISIHLLRVASEESVRRVLLLL